MVPFVVWVLVLALMKAGFPSDSDLTPGWRGVKSVVTWILKGILIAVTGLVILGLLLLGLCLAVAR